MKKHKSCCQIWIFSEYFHLLTRMFKKGKINKPFSTNCNKIYLDSQTFFQEQEKNLTTETAYNPTITTPNISNTFFGFKTTNFHKIITMPQLWV